MKLGTHVNVWLGNIRVHSPALAVENHVGMFSMYFGNNRIDGFSINQAHKIEAESVDTDISNLTVECNYCEGPWSDLSVKLLKLNGLYRDGK